MSHKPEIAMTPFKDSIQRPVREALLDMAIKSCKKLQGAAEIGEGYFIVDSKLYNIERKPNV